MIIILLLISITLIVSLVIFQTQKIREKLCHRSNITIDSVESFQGSERRIIIISLSRSEQLGFLSEYKVIILNI